MAHPSTNRGSSRSSRGDGVLQEMLSGDMKIPEGGLDTRMAHQALDGMEVHPGLQEMGRERMPQ